MQLHCNAVEASDPVEGLTDAQEGRPRRATQRIARAVWAVTADRGLEAATLRDVTAEAGVSMGVIQHYGPKDRMILFACEHLVELAEQGTRTLAGRPLDEVAAQ